MPKTDYGTTSPLFHERAHGGADPGSGGTLAASVANRGKGPPKTGNMSPQRPVKGRSVPSIAHKRIMYLEIFVF